MLYVGWDQHLLFCAPFCFPLPPTMPFGDVVKGPMTASFSAHPDFSKIDWSKVTWLKSGKPWTPDFNKTLAENGLKHKDAIRFKTPGLNGIKGSCFALLVKTDMTAQPLRSALKVGVDQAINIAEQPDGPRQEVQELRAAALHPVPGGLEGVHQEIPVPSVGIHITALPHAAANFADLLLQSHDRWRFEKRLELSARTRRAYTGGFSD